MLTDNDIAEIFGPREPLVLDCLNLNFEDEEIKALLEPLREHFSPPIVAPIPDPIEQKAVDNAAERKPLLPKQIDDACQAAANKRRFFGTVQVPKFDFSTFSFFEREKLPDIKPAAPGALSKTTGPIRPRI